MIGLFKLTLQAALELERVYDTVKQVRAHLAPKTFPSTTIQVIEADNTEIKYKYNEFNVLKDTHAYIESTAACS
jgi:hypothetical protein